MNIKEILFEHCWKNENISCPTSFTEYNGKKVVELKKFWHLLFYFGINTYKENMPWYDVVLSQISEKSLKQKLTYYCRYGTLNSPRGFKQILEYLSNGKKVEVEPKDMFYPLNSFEYDYRDFNNYIIKIDGKEIEVDENKWKEIVGKT